MEVSSSLFKSAFVYRTLFLPSHCISFGIDGFGLASSPLSALDTSSSTLMLSNMLRFDISCEVYWGKVYEASCCLPRINHGTSESSAASGSHVRQSQQKRTPKIKHRNFTQAKGGLSSKRPRKKSSALSWHLRAGIGMFGGLKRDGQGGCRRPMAT